MLISQDPDFFYFEESKFFLFRNFAKSIFRKIQLAIPETVGDRSIKLCEI